MLTAGITRMMYAMSEVRAIGQTAMLTGTMADVAEWVAVGGWV